MDKNSLAYWFPRISGLGIPVPKTVLISCNQKDIWTGEIDGLMSQLMDCASTLGYPVFMKTDLCAGKHDWKNTCYVKSASMLQNNLYRLAEFNELAGGAMGLPYNYIVLREFLNLETSFTAFPGDMPINKERRYFIRDGKVICHHPYWPKEAFEDRSESPNWETHLEFMNWETQAEIKLLTQYAETVAGVLPEFWSVDFAKAKSGTWYLIDMALGEQSYHWKGCPNAVAH